MSFHHRLLASAYRPLKFARDAHSLVRPRSGDRLRVLLYHDIAGASQARFAAQLRWVGHRWRFVAPDEFADMASGRVPIVGRNVLLTFDDGFATDRVVAEQVLEPLGIRALFFVVPNFVDCVEPEEARRFVAQRIRPGSDASNLPSHLGNMAWSDLVALLDNGHGIGAHTRSHAKLSALAGEQLVDEIVGGADLLASRLGVPIDHFAFPFGNLTSFSPAALRIARERFLMIYSGLRGDNAGRVSTTVLRRDAVPPTASPALVGSLLEGGADFHYGRQRHQLDAWERQTVASPSPLGEKRV
jgi:peptidoglycan/xylan/chitin deacetylase (PgdA/CDA1 family)